jgi:sterol desaturase/sphingolipid hydroxylase (fatty acid hydroxylase superfamily)
MLTYDQSLALIVVALMGHIMALFWYLADRYNARLFRKRIYDIPLPAGQLRQEIINSVYTPVHSIMLGIFLVFGFFQNTTWTSFILSLLMTAVWAEIWHYFSHRAFHLNKLHWIHEKHHKSQINSPFTAISFSFTEKLIFNLGIMGFMALMDTAISVNFFGVAGWYVGYLFINSYSHANFEIKSGNFLQLIGKFLTSTTYHALHHSRYRSNYGLGTRLLDQIFGTEAKDYEDLYKQITTHRVPLKKLSERCSPQTRL